MRRREFISLLGGAAVAWPLAARAAGGQAADQRVHRIQHAIGREPTNYCLLAAAARTRMDRGSQHRNRTSLWGRSHRPTLRVCDRLRSPQGRCHCPAKQATSVIPIVIAAAGDPVGSGVVAGLARPGGNVTGLSLQQRDLSGKRLELLREALPGLRRLAIMADVGNSVSGLEMSEVQATARALDLDVVTAEIRRTEDIAPAFAALKGARVEAVYVASSPLVNANRIRINTWALAVRLPTIHGSRENVEAGGVLSYGPNFLDLFRRSADIVDKILRGAKPADIPVEQPTRFDFVVNLMTAQALGLHIPAALLVRADEVIE
jgi:putative tryptophan/tyrosine transport system substrate-binding protein